MIVDQTTMSNSDCAI